MLNFSVEKTDDESEIKKQMEEELNRLIYDIADEVHNEASILITQRSHDKGTLLKSLNVDYGNMWAKIGANTPYAKADHDGFEGHIQLVPSAVIREHQRKGAGGKTHTVTQHMRGEHARWMPARTGKKYLDDAIRNVLSRLDPEVRDMITIERMDGDM